MRAQGPNAQCIHYRHVYDMSSWSLITRVISNRLLFDLNSHWIQRGLNSGPFNPKSTALPAELTRLCCCLVVRRRGRRHILTAIRCFAIQTLLKISLFHVFASFFNRFPGLPDKCFCVDQRFWISQINLLFAAFYYFCIKILWEDDKTWKREISNSVRSEQHPKCWSKYTTHFILNYFL